MFHPHPEAVSSDAEQYLKKTCRYCDSRLSDPFLELGSMPLANSFLTPEQAMEPEFKCPLSLAWCAKCGLVQLTHVVPPDLMFSNYLYVSSTTKTFQVHFAEYAKAVRQKLRVNQSKPVAVDIGSNDGLLVFCYGEQGMQGIGIEPAKNLSDAANQQSRKTINRYFDAECVQKILAEYGPAAAISANNVFAHIDDIQNVLKNVANLLDERGIFVLEFPYLVTMFDEMLFDMIYHEHLSYISVSALTYVMNRFGLQIFDIHYVPSHGGSLRVFVQKKDGPYAVEGTVAQYLKNEKAKGYGKFPVYEDFAKRVKRVREDLIQCVQKIKSESKTVSGYGAPAKAGTIINFCGFAAEDILYIVDDNPLKQNRLSPGARIPIVPSAHLERQPTDYVIIFAWNFANEIIAKIAHLKQKGIRFIIPLPKPTIL